MFLPGIVTLDWKIEYFVMVVFTDFIFVNIVLDLVVGLVTEMVVLAPFALDDIVIYLLVELNFNVVRLRIDMVEEVLVGFVNVECVVDGSCEFRTDSGVVKLWSVEVILSVETEERNQIRLKILVHIFMRCKIAKSGF